MRDVRIALCEMFAYRYARYSYNGIRNVHPEFYRMAKLGKLDYASFVVWQNCKAGGCTDGHFNALLNR